MSAAERWSQALAAWSIPQHILEAAPQSPWGYSTASFARRADAALAAPTPSAAKALEALPAGGVALDIGCGAGAASLPLAHRADRLIGVDSSAEMLAAFRGRARAVGTAVSVFQETWPVATDVPVADVVVCHHVAYNVPDLAAFVRQLTAHARRRVVLELTAQHPLSVLNELWLQFHNLSRPTAPAADDASAVLREAGLKPERAEWMASTFGPFASRDELVAWIRRRLCLAAERDGEIAAAIAARIVRRPDGIVGFPPRPVVALWWDGMAIERRQTHGAATR